MWAPSCPRKTFFWPFPRFSGKCPKIPRGGVRFGHILEDSGRPGGGLWGAPAPRAGPILTVKNRGFRALGPWRAPRCEKLFLAILTFFGPFSGWKTKKRQKLMKKGDWAKGPRGAKSSRIYSRISAPAPNFRAPKPPPSVPKLAVLGQEKRKIQENRKISNFYIFDHFWNNFCVENGPVPLQRGPLPQGSLQRGPWKPKDRRQDNCRNSAFPDFWGKNNRKKLLKLRKRTHTHGMRETLKCHAELLLCYDPPSVRPCFCVLRVHVFVCAPRHAVPGSQNPAQATSTYVWILMCTGTPCHNAPGKGAPAKEKAGGTRASRIELFMYTASTYT